MRSLSSFKSVNLKPLTLILFYGINKNWRAMHILQKCRVKRDRQLKVNEEMKDYMQQNGYKFITIFFYKI